MDLDPIPGLSEELNDEVSTANGEFSGEIDHQNTVAGPSTSLVDLDESVDDEEEQVLLEDFFNGDPCCSLGPDKTACWKLYGRESFKVARQDFLELEKAELDLAVLAVTIFTFSQRFEPHLCKLSVWRQDDMQEGFHVCQQYRNPQVKERDDPLR